MCEAECRHLLAEVPDRQHLPSRPALAVKINQSKRTFEID